MARREDIDTAIWDDPDFRQLASDAKLVYVWSFTNGCGMAGVYKLDQARITFDTSLPPARAKLALENLCERDYLVMAESWVWVRTRVKRLRTRSSQMAWSVIADLEHLREDHPIRAAFVGEYLTCGWLIEKGGERWREFCDATVLVVEGAAKPKTETLDRGSGEPRVSPKGNGKGSSSTDTTEETAELDAPGRIYEHWRSSLSPQARFTDERRAKVRARLKHYSEERILRAIDGCAGSEFHVDGNHVDLKLICRSDEQLERFESLPLKAEQKPEKPKWERHSNVLAMGSVHTCRSCPNAISNLQANNQSGMCDECYETHIEALIGPEAA